MTKVSVSVLNSKNLKEDILLLNNTSANYIHLDIMDGKFVTNKTATFSSISNALTHSKKKLDVHLMVNNPSKYIKDYSLFDTEYITIHEEIKNYQKYLEEIRSYGLKCGISIKPNTSIDKIIPILDKIDLVLIMSVEPGAGGQPFMEEVLIKIRNLKEEITKRNLNVVIEVDGGINNINSKWCINNGADILVSGTYILNGNYEENIKNIKE